MNRKWNKFILNEDNTDTLKAKQESIEEQLEAFTDEMQELFDKTISENMSYHIKNKISIVENIFRPSSKADLMLINEGRKLWKEGKYDADEDEKLLFETDIGLIGEYNGKKVFLDMPMLVEKKKDPPLNKPTRNSGGGKKYKVYVRDPKTKNVKKVTFGDSAGGLKGNWNDPEARASFAKRHKCDQKKDKTKAGYWACRAHKYFGKNVPGRFW